MADADPTPPNASPGLTIEPLFDYVDVGYAPRTITDPATGVEFEFTAPVTWSDQAVTILATKYARKTGVPKDARPWTHSHTARHTMNGELGSETHARQLFVRLAGCWASWGLKLGYFDSHNAGVFRSEITAMLEQQVAAPNSPQWFNTGLAWAYGITGEPQGHYASFIHGDAIPPASRVGYVEACNDAYTRPQAHACFIQGVEDNLVGDNGIIDLMHREARLFKFGSGTGTNYSNIRAKGEPMSGGGTSSGLMSFLRVSDANAGAIKSGGTCLSPDQRVYTERGPVAVQELAERDEDFIVLSYDPPAGRYKAKKARAWKAGHKQLVKVITDKGEFKMTADHPIRLACGSVRKAGDLGVGDSLFRCSVDLQAGYVRVHLRNGLKGKARWHRMIMGDVLGHDLTGNVVHHINHDKLDNRPSNLQVTTQSAHATDHGRELSARGEHVFQKKVFTHVGENNGMSRGSDFWQDPEKSEAYRQKQGDMLNASGRAASMQRKSSEQRMLNIAFKVRNAGSPVDTFDDYVEGRQKHIGRIPSVSKLGATINKYFGDYAGFLQALDANNHRVTAVEILEYSDVYDVEVDCPTLDDKTPESGHNFVIWQGDDHAGSGVVVFNTRRAARMIVLDVDHPDIEDFIEWKGREDKKVLAMWDAGIGERGSFEDDATNTVSGQNGNNSVRLTDKFMQAVKDGGTFDLTWRTSGEVAKTVDARELWAKIADSAWQCADPGVQFHDTINRWHTCHEDGEIKASNPCCLQSSTLVATVEGYITIETLAKREGPLPDVHCYDGEKWTTRKCLRAWQSGEATAMLTVFTTSHKLRCTPEHRFMLASGEYVEAQQLTQGAELQTPKGMCTVLDTSLEARYSASDTEPVYDIEVEALHNFGIASDELKPPVAVHNSEYMFLDETACNLASLNLVKFVGADGVFDVKLYRHAVRLWTIVLDISVSMAGYPSEAIAKQSMQYRTLGLGYANLGGMLMRQGIPYDSGEGRALCARVTSLLGAFSWQTSAELAQHLGAFPAYERNKSHVLRVLGLHQDSASSAQVEWRVAVACADSYGVRNAQCTLLAPTGTISFVMDCDSTGIEPVYALQMSKRLAGGGYMQITCPAAEVYAARVGPATETVEAILSKLQLVDPVLECANDIDWLGHLGMMAAAQPFLCGAISKTVNLPSSATRDDIAACYEWGFENGLKAVAVYRDNSKAAQVLTVKSNVEVTVREGKDGQTSYEASQIVDDLVTNLWTSDPLESALYRGQREEPPARRSGETVKLKIAGESHYVTLNRYADGRPCEVFVETGKQGGTVRGWAGAFAMMLSHYLQVGGEVAPIIDKLRYQRFDPAGFVSGGPLGIRSATSPVDALAQALSVLLGPEDATPSPAPETTEPATERLSAETPRAPAKTNSVCSVCRSTHLQPAGTCLVCMDCGATTGCG